MTGEEFNERHFGIKICGLCDKPATTNAVDMIYFYGENKWRYVELDGPVHFFCAEHSRDSLMTPRENRLDGQGRFVAANCLKAANS